jgi:hypothetical protein
MQLKICENNDNTINIIGKKDFKPVINQASKWVREETRLIKALDFPQTTDGLKVISKAKTMSGSLIPNALGYLLLKSNNPYENAKSVGLFTMAYINGHGLSVTQENIRKCCSLFVARKSIKSNWINQKDEYSAPNTEHQDYNLWNNDAVIYSLFHASSRQSSLRNVIYKEKIYQIKNEFFFMSKEEIKKLADICNNVDIYNDVNFEQNERYVYLLLKEMQLSEDAKNILKSARDLVSKTMPMRETYSREHPELNLNSWDAGYLQQNGLWKECANDKFEQFRKDYLNFDKRMMEGVYKFGFLEPDFSTNYNNNQR